jgi:hypothetical protein
MIPSSNGGGVCAIEMALWDIVGKGMTHGHIRRSEAGNFATRSASTPTQRSRRTRGFMRNETNHPSYPSETPIRENDFLNERVPPEWRYPRSSGR